MPTFFYRSPVNPERICRIDGIPWRADGGSLVIGTKQGAYHIPAGLLDRDGFAWFCQFQSTRPAAERALRQAMNQAYMENGHHCRVGRATIPKLSRSE